MANLKDVVQVYERDGDQYKIIGLKILDRMTPAQVMEKNIIIKINNIFFCSHDLVCRQYVEKGKTAIHVSRLFKAYHDSLIRSGWSPKSEIDNVPIGNMRKILTIINVMGPETRIVQ